MEKGFSPVGLRVLVVDDDPTWLKILERMLKKCSYEVTTCGLAREALRLLRERKDGFDIVISDVNMPDMDGFKLLEHVGLELDLPVIMMSVDGETSRVMKGVQHGACDYLLKPIRMKELKIIWQHVLRKKLQEVRDIEGCYDVGAEWITQAHFLGRGEDVSFGKKRKDFDFEKKLLHDESDPSSSKKARVVWSYELHQKFVNAVNQIGCDHKAGPKKILDLMNIPWLTRENVASHLQKYRLYLSRLEKGKEIKCYSSGVKNIDSPPKDAEINSNPGKSSYASFSRDNSLLLKATETDPKQLASASVSDPTSDVHMPPKAKKTRIGFDPPISSGVFDSLLPWNDVPDPLESKPTIMYENSFLQQQPLASQSSYVANSAPSLMQEEMKPSYVNADEFLMPQDNNSTVTLQDLNLSAPSAMKLQESSSNATSNTESTPGSLSWEHPEAHHSGSLDTESDFSWLQGEHFFANTGLQDFQLQDYSCNPSFLSELPSHLWFGNERLPDPDEYTLMVDQGLFIS